MTYNKTVVAAFFKDCGLPEPVFEYQFCERKWRWDLAYPDHRLAIEVQGALFSGGRHTRGAALLKEYEKYNYAARLGWRILFVIPRDLCLMETVRLIHDSLSMSLLHLPAPDRD